MCGTRGVRIPTPFQEQNEMTMTRNIYNRIAIILTAAMAAASCSVKEDRTPCPCWLDIDITSCAEHAREVTLAGWNGTRVFFEKVAVADYPDVYETTVTKGMVTSTAFCGLHESTLEGSRILIPEGKQADQIRAHAALVDCTGESARDKVELCRQYATVYLSMKGEEDVPNPYDIEIVTDICGIDITSLSPVEGSFRFAPQSDGDGVWIFRLPRLKEETPVTARMLLEGSLVDELPLDSWIRQTGYSWLEKDLKEIYIGVDYAAGKVSVTVQGWEEGESMDIII